MRWVSYTFIFISLFFGRAICADENEALIRFHQDVDLKMRLMNTLVQTQKRLELSLTGLESQNLSPERFDQEWTKSFREITEEYINKQSEIAGLSTEDKKPVRGMMHSLRWSELSQLHLKLWRKSKVIARTSGVNLLGSLIIANILNYVIPYFLTLMGQPVLAAIIFIAPVNPPTIFLHHAVSSMQFEMRMRKLIGGKQAVKDYRKLNEDILKELALVKKTDYFVPALGEEPVYFIASNTNIKATIAKKFGLASEQLSIGEIRQFFVREGLTEPAYMGLLDDPILEERVKVIMIINHLSTDTRPDLFARFKLRFSKFMVAMPSSPQEVDSIYQWVRSITQSKSTQDIHTLISRAPRDIHPFHLLSVWEEIIIPELARGDQLNYRQMRKLASGFHMFKIKKELDLTELRSGPVIAELSAYFTESMDLSRRSCFRSQQEIIKSLY